MRVSSARRICTVVLALIILTIPIITPLTELTGTHNHACSPAKCALCIINGTLRGIGDLTASVISALLPFIILIYCIAARILRSDLAIATPVALKTKILS